MGIQRSSSNVHSFEAWNCINKSLTCFMAWCRWIPRSISPSWFVCCCIKQKISWMSTALHNKERLPFHQVSDNLFMNYKQTKPDKLQNSCYQKINNKENSNFWENDWSTNLYLSANHLMNRSLFKQLLHKSKNRNEQKVCCLITAIMKNENICTSLYCF